MPYSNSNAIRQSRAYGYQKDRKNHLGLIILHLKSEMIMHLPLSEIISIVYSDDIVHYVYYYKFIIYHKNVQIFIDFIAFHIKRYALII